MVAGGGDGYISITGGKVSQLHLQDVQAFSMPTDSIMVSNDFTTPFVEINNLNELTEFSNGDALGNKWFKIVVWTIANKTGQPSFMLLNMPRKGEGDSTKAIEDKNGYANYTIPQIYKSKAILNGAFAIQVDNGVFDYDGDSEDLRGSIPSNIAGGGGGGGVTTLLALEDVFATTHAGKQGQVIMGNGTNGVD